MVPNVRSPSHPELSRQPNVTTARLRKKHWNGLAERAVQSFKHSMSKLKDGSLLDKLSRVLFYSHITPHSTTGQSPAELLQNRRLKSRLDLLRPDLENHIFDSQNKQQ